MMKYLNSSLRVLFPETCCTNDTLTVSRLAMPPFERPPENLARRRRRGSTAATLHAAGIREVESLAQAPEALRPVAGEAAFVICAGRDWDWPAGGAGARRIGGLCDRRSAQMAGRLGAAAAAGQSLLRDDHPEERGLRTRLPSKKSTNPLENSCCRKVTLSTCCACNWPWPI
jgi:hypothetical protein